jgi:hypothetical protein
MVGILSPKRRLTRLERGFEFSRLQDEWMAAVYALVLEPERHGRRVPRTQDADCAKDKSAQAARRHRKRGKAK